MSCRFTQSFCSSFITEDLKIFLLQIFFKSSELQIYLRFCSSFTVGRFIQYFVQIHYWRFVRFQDFKIFPVEDSPQDFKDFAKDSQDFRTLWRLSCWRFSSRFSRFQTTFKTWLQTSWSCKDSRFLDFNVYYHYSLSLFICENCTFILHVFWMSLYKRSSLLPL